MSSSVQLTKNFSVRKYADLNSAYRDRKINPLPTNYEVIYNNLGRRGTLGASFDPVSEQSAIEQNVTSLISAAPNVIHLSGVGNGDYIDRYYNRRQVEWFSGGGTKEIRTVTNFIPVGLTATVTPPYSGNPGLGDQYIVRNEVPVARLGINNGLITSNSLILNTDPLTSPISTVSTTLDFYKGMYLEFIGLPFNSDRYRIINSFNPATNIVTFTPPLSPNQVAALNALVPFTYTNGVAILAYSYDNMVPLLYNGTDVMSQPVCYRARMIQISLPNLPILSGYGGTLDNYPFFYVTFQNTENKAAEQILYTNNPNAKSVTFKVYVEAPSYDDAKSFIVLKATDQYQTFKFKPNSNIRVIVTHPDGQVLQYTVSDTHSPLPPEPLLQTSILVEMERLE